MKQHFVTFYSPGTFVAEERTLKIDSWNVNDAIELSKTITERYDAKPYGFRFSTRERDEYQLDSQETNQSGFYWLGGKVCTIQELKEMGESETLIRNMEINGWEKCVVNTNSWKWTMPLGKEDIVLGI